MTFPNHYQTLQVAPTATMEEIKKAYRKLALRFHPDKAGSDESTLAAFRAIKSAYDVLINSKSRQAYHAKYFYHTTPPKPTLTANELADKAKALAAFVRLLDPFRIDYDLLTLEIAQIVNPEAVRIFKNTKELFLIEGTINSILACLALMPYKIGIPFHAMLLSISENHAMLLISTKLQLKKQQRIDWWQRKKPLLALVVALLICLLMYWAAK